MEFIYNASQPSTYEGWLEKANIGIFERWQRRYFRIQGRCVYYFKKDQGSDPPNGNIPLVDIEVTDLPAKKGRMYGFKVYIKNPEICKRQEYLISADCDDTRSKWKKAMTDNSSVSIVKKPFVEATRVHPFERDVNLLVPYFIPPVMNILETTAFKLRNIWTVEVPNEIVAKGFATLDQNYFLHTEDIHNAVAVILAYIKSLPDGLLDGTNMIKFASKVTPEELRELVRSAPAPIRQFVRVIGLHFKKVLDNTSSNGVTQYSLLPIIGQMLMRPANGSFMPPAQTKEIQDIIAKTFLANAPMILDDVHQFLDAPRMPVIRRARIINTLSLKSDEILDGTRGLLVHVVREDDYGWCTVFTTNRRVGLMHNSNLRDLTKDEEQELQNGPNIDALFDVVREHLPEMMLLFDSMNEEIMKIRDALDAVKTA